jgi:hypothetical protein
MRDAGDAHESFTVAATDPDHRMLLPRFAFCPQMHLCAVDGIAFAGRVAEARDRFYVKAVGGVEPIASKRNLHVGQTGSPALQTSDLSGEPRTIQR